MRFITIDRPLSGMTRKAKRAGAAVLAALALAGGLATTDAQAWSIQTGCGEYAGQPMCYMK